MQDSELINRCIQKDNLAWSEFVKRYSGLIYWAINNRLKKWDYLYGPEDVEEIHQNVFLAIWKRNKLEQIKEHKKISSWLITISSNEAVDYFRYQKYQTPPNAISIYTEIAQRDKTLTLADILPSGDQNPASETTAEEIENILNEEITGLTAKEKSILKLNILYNKKYREIAEMLNIPIGSVSTVLKNIRIKLKRRLKGKI